MYRGTLEAFVENTSYTRNEIRTDFVIILNSCSRKPGDNFKINEKIHFNAIILLCSHMVIYQRTDTFINMDV